jgi:hypothetical protein
MQGGSLTVARKNYLFMINQLLSSWTEHKNIKAKYIQFVIINTICPKYILGKEEGNKVYKPFYIEARLRVSKIYDILTPLGRVEKSRLRCVSKTTL